MERYLRVAAPIGGGALIVSLVVGLLAGVSFGTVLLRALVSGALFAAAGVGLMAVTPALLPGLLDPSSPGGDNGSEPAGADGEGREAAQPSAGSRLNIVVEETDEPADNEDDDLEEGSSDDLVEEVEEQSVTDEQAVMKAAIEEEQDGNSVEIDDTMLDEMPDIGSFAGSFSSSAETEEGDAGPESGSDQPISPSGEHSAGGTGSTGGQGFDPETIAKALRTVIERDNES